jgi:hypothetical protein
MLRTFGETVIRNFDNLLRRAYGIFEFTDDDDCIFRLALGKSTKEMTLSDGTTVKKGEPLGGLHLWNERVPAMPPEGPDMAWAAKAYRLLLKSLHCLATYVERESAFRDVKIFGGETALLLIGSEQQTAAFFKNLGFDLVRPRRSRLRRFGELWENMYNWAIIWTFNPASLSSKRLSRLSRYQVWISRRTLLQKHGQN